MPGFAFASISAAALRVASLDLCADEYLLLLAKPGEIASVSRLSHDPMDSPLWRTGRRYPASRGSLEDVLATRPNLLLSMGGGGRATRLIAGRLGLRSIALAYPEHIGDVEVNMVKVATALGDPRRANPWRRRLRALRAVPAKPVEAMFLTRSGDGVAADSLAAEWMRLGGLAQRRGPRATIESLAVNPPQVMLVSDYRRDQASLGQGWIDHPLIRRAASKRVATDGRPWTCGGPLMLAEIERLRRR